MNLTHYPHFIHRVIPILLLVAYLLPFSADAAGNITFSASTTGPYNPSTLFIATPSTIQYPPYYGCLFFGTTISSGTQLPAPGGGTQAVSTTTDLIGQFSASESPDLLTYLNSHSGTYTLAIASGGTGNCSGDVVPNYSYAGSFIWNNGFAGQASTTDNRTHFTLVIPDNQTVASGTPISLEAFGNIKDSDASNDLVITWRITGVSTAPVANCADVICAFSSPNDAGTYTFKNFVIVPGQRLYFDESTTSTATYQNGYYTLQTSISRPSTLGGILGLIGINWGAQTLAATTTYFTVGTTTSAQTILNEALGLYGLSSATSTSALKSTCNPLAGAFDVGTCVQLLFYPSQNDLTAMMNTFKDGFLSRMPWGYATRAVSIITGTASDVSTTTLPAFEVTVPEGATASDTLAFDPQDMIVGGVAILDSVPVGNTGLHIRDVIDPYIQLFVAISVIFIIITDLLAMGVHENDRRKYS